MEALGTSLFVFGGETVSGFSNELFAIDTSNLQWTALADVTVSGRSQHGFCVMHAALFVFGGLTANGPSNELFKYVPSTSTWVTINAANSPTPRYSAGLTAVQGVLYTFGGATSTGYSMELFKCQVAEDGITGTWTQLDTAAGVQGQVAQASSGHALFSSGAYLYLFAGWRDTGSLNADGSQGVYFNKLFQFHTSKLTWSQIISTADSAKDHTPNPRRDFGIALLQDSTMIVFGGSTGDVGGIAGRFTNDLRIRMLPREWGWPYSGITGFLPIYDEDTVTIQGSSILDVSIDLCSGEFIPCTLIVMGAAGSSLSRTIEGQLGCHASLGCSSVLLQEVTLLCDLQDVAEIGPLQISGKGASLNLDNCTISGCSSVQDGGSARIHDGAKLLMSDSSISHSSSQVGTN